MSWTGAMEDLKYQNMLTEAEVLEILHKALDTDFRLLNYATKPASDDPKGFLGEHYLLAVEISTERQTKQLSFFVKKTPEIPLHLHYVQKTRAFYKEVEFYKTVFADFDNAQSSLQPTKWRPEFYYSRGSDIIVMEDLLNEGYYIYPERCCMDEEHVIASLKVLAAMHAASVVFEERFNAGQVPASSLGFKSVKGTVTLGEIYPHLTFETEVTGVKGHPGNDFHEAGIGGPVKVVEYLSGYSQEEKKVIQERLPEVMRRIFQLVKTSERYKNVFVHGDLWGNNLLFRKDGAGNVAGALIIDFQLVRYAPPAHDIMMFLHFVQNKQYLQTRRDYLLECYYSAFSEELKKHSIQAKSILPWDSFVDSCDFYEDLGLISKLFFFQLILAPPEVTSEFLSSPELFAKNFLTDRTEMVVKCFLEDEICRSRMTEALDEVIGRFIIP